MSRAQNEEPSRKEDFDGFLAAQLAKLRGPWYDENRHKRRSGRYKRIGKALFLLALTGALLVFMPPSVWTTLFPDSYCKGIDTQITGPASQRRVALVDQLSVENPNPRFVQNVASTVDKQGYGFDYFPPNTVTVDFFAALPSRGYSMIIFRTHGTADVVSGPSTIVTSENYSESSHVVDQLLNRLTDVHVNGQRYFALTPAFISEVVCGRFSGTLILAMFCSGGQLTFLAKSFIDKGASAFIGWNGPVTASHTDLVFETLLASLTDGISVTESVQSATANLGADPIYGSQLLVYP